uniref:Uncharacterized protein n=1 Tax=Brugia timori TaxID=42155 RepID=A0A0R3QFB9_9BILA
MLRQKRRIKDNLSIGEITTLKVNYFYCKLILKIITLNVFISIFACN